MLLTPRQFDHARRWLPLWGLLLVLMSFGSRAAADLCTLTPHCSESERSLEKAMPCGSFTTVLAMSLLSSDSLLLAALAPAAPDFLSPSLYVPQPPLERFERPPRSL